MLRRSFRSSTINAASAVGLVLVWSGACARATQEDPDPVATGGQFSGTPTGGTAPASGGTLSTTGGFTAPSGGTAPVTGGTTSGGKASGGTTASGGKSSGGSSSSSGGGPTGGKAATTGGIANEGGEASSPGGAAGASGAGDAGQSATGGRGGGGSGGGSGGTKSTGGITGNSADCDFDAPECASLSCEKACPTGMGTYCADSCQDVIDCIDENPTCGTSVDPMCVRRNGGTAAKCTGAWEMASGAQTPIGVPAQTAIDFFNCACGGVVPTDPGGGDGGSGGAPPSGEAGSN